MVEERKLSRHLSPSLSDAELTQQWRSIEDRLSERRPRWKVWALSVALAALMTTVVVVWFVPRAPESASASAWDGAVLESIQDEVSVSLGDGTRIELLPVSKVVVREGSVRAVHLDLRRGGARFDVTHVAGRSFDVTAAGVRVRVVGTCFSVTTAEVPGGERVTVTVERGAIEADIGAAREPIRVRAGETWSVVRPKAEEPNLAVDRELAPARAASALAAPTASQAAPAPQPATLTPPAEVETTDTPEQSSPSPRAPSSTSPPDSPAAHPAAAAAVAAAPTAQDLFEKGNTARQSGDPGGAAMFYESLLRNYPTDARAGLTAFELGRLKMDQLGDVRGAVGALQRAVTLAKDSGFREDALARLAQAYGSLGDTGRCERAQGDYLRSYPSGVHATAVRVACRPKSSTPAP